MRFASIRMPVRDVAASARFYEALTGVSARWGNENLFTPITPEARARFGLD